MTDIKTIHLPIKSVKEIAENTVEITFDTKKERLPFEAGQHVQVTLPYTLHNDPAGNKRFFSITSSPENKSELSIILRVSDSPFKQTLVRMPRGMSVEVHGPLGIFVLPEDTKNHLVFVAGGIGITPFLSMLHYIVDRNTGHKATLIYSNSNEKKEIYKKELSSLAEKNPNITVKSIIGELDAKKVISLISEKDFKKARWYVAGPPDMVSAMRYGLEDLKVLRKDILADEFFGYEKVAEQEKEMYKGELENFLVNSKKMASIIRNSFDGIVITDREGVIQYVNPSWEEITGWTLKEVVGQVTPRIVKSGQKDEKFYEELWRTITSGMVFRSEITNKKKNGETYDTDEIIVPFLNDKNAVIGFAGFQRDITERKKMDRMRTEFVSVASHQLRTPITTIKLFAELLADKDFGDLSEKQKKYVNEIQNATTRMVGLINDLLDMSRIESGKLKINKQYIKSEDLLQDMLDETKIFAKENNCQISFKVPEVALPKIYTDPHLLNQVFRNILNNAIKYSKNRSCSVNIELELFDGHIRAKLEDDGIGISKEDSEMVFTRFFRAQNAVQKETDGSGLGLHVAKNIIDMLGGEIWFESELGKGTTFYVTMPISNKP